MAAVVAVVTLVESAAESVASTAAAVAAATDDDDGGITCGGCELETIPPFGAEWTNAGSICVTFHPVCPVPDVKCRLANGVMNGAAATSPIPHGIFELGSSLPVDRIGNSSCSP